MKGFPEYKNLVEMTSTQKEAHDAKELMVFLGESGNREGSLSFSGLDIAARQIALGLTEQGLAGKNVVLLYAPGLDYIKAFFGCLYAGVVPVPAYPPMGARDIERLKRVVLDCSAGAILTSSMILPMVEAWVSNPSNGLNIKCIPTDQLHNESNISGFTPHQAEPDDIAFLQYTSGSTGHPKGVMVSHGNLLSNFEQIVGAFTESADFQTTLPNFRTVIWLPPFHDMGLIGGVLTPVYVGATVTLMSPLTFLKNPYLWLKTISDVKAKVTGGPNFSYQYCVRKISEAQMSELDLSSLEVAFNGAEPIHLDSLHRFAEHFSQAGFRRTAFLPCYGLAESTLFVSGAKKGTGPKALTTDLASIAEGQVAVGQQTGNARTVELVSSGVIASETEVRIVDPQKLTAQKEGQIGEVWVNSPSVASGYWEKPGYSKSVFKAQIKGDTESDKTYLRTGDLGFIHEGELYITGRIKELIIVAGKNHYPQDIEWSLQSSDPLLRKGCGAAFSVTEDGQEQLVVMQEVNKSNTHINYREIALAGSRAIVTRHGISPKTLVFIAPGILPKTSSGKIQRVEAKKLYTSGNLVPLFMWESVSCKSISSTQDTSHSHQLAEQAYTDWHSHLYKEMQRWVSDKLNIDAHHIDLDVPFSELGVDSIEAVELIDRLQEQIQRTIPATELMRYSTVKALINQLANEITEKYSEKLDELVDVEK